MLAINDYLSLFPPHTREKPRFMALATAVLSQVNDLLSLIQSGFPAAWDLETASGNQLDVLGELLNTPRPAANTSDADYRFLLQARIAADHWDGTNETYPALLEEALPGLGASMLDNHDGTITVSVASPAPFPLEDLIPCPAGIRMITE